jgi:PAS domain S-box-containing protein
MADKKIKETAHGPMLSLTEVAGFLRCHHNTVRAWVRQGKLVPVPMGPEKVPMFRKEDVEALRTPLEQVGVIMRDDKQAFPVVGIGASAGGLDAISRTLAHLPTDLGLAYVVVQHLEVGREGVLAELLRKKTTMPVAVIENGMRLSPDRVYLAPATAHVALSNNTFTLSAPKDATRPIDAFFTALAHEYQNNAIGIVLSGTGNDGTEGLRAIHEEDGLTLAQDAGALEQSMPRNAMDAEVVDVVVKAEAVGSELVELVKQLYPAGQARIPSKHENELGRILQYLHAQRGIDFTHYKEATIHRRIIRRMVLSKCRKLSDYSALLHGMPSEVDTLCNDMLINVTSFFRDPAFFKALDQLVFPALLKDRRQNEPLRIWVAACAGGEEVVSIAMALLEHVGDRALTVPVQIFATDLNERAVEKARLGIYKKNALQSVPPELVKKYFQHVDGHYQVIKAIRDMCVFAKHDLLKDPPFSRVDLISCQNMLIYLDNAAQEQVVKSFHYALKPQGYLALGRSESATVAGEIFDQPDRNFKVYTRKYSGGERLTMDVRYKPTAAHQPQSGISPATSPRGTFANELDRDTERLLLNRYVPANVLVNKSLEIVRFRGSMTPYLAPASGKASLNLLKMVRDDLAFDLRMLLQRVKKERAAVRKGGIRMRVDDSTHKVALEIVPMGDQRDPHYLVLFTEEQSTRTDEPTGRRTRTVRDERERRILLLEQELAEAREQMRVVAEEAEASQQDLQSANEEVVSSNEELQSINEELETSKEELQSINEEFATINEELQARNEALLESEERYRKLIDLMPVAVYTCDASGHVRLFNEAAVRLWGRTPVVGETRWCGSASMRTVEGKELPLDQCPMALAIKEERALSDVESVVVQPNGEQRAVLANPTPLYDHSGKVSGAINVLVDITERQRAEADRQQLSGMLERSLNEIYIFDLESLKFDYVNHGALSNLGYTLEQMRHMTPVDIKPEMNARQFDAMVKPLSSGEKEKLLFYTVHRRADGSDYPVEVHLQIVNKGPRRMYMAMILDITERKLNEERLQVITRTGKLGIWDWDIVADTITWTDPVYEIHGVEKGSFAPTMDGYEALIHPEDRERVGAAIKATLETDAPYTIEFRTLNAQGEVNWVYTNAVVLREGQRPVRMLGGTMNITERKKAESDLQNSEARFRAIYQHASFGIVLTDETGRMNDVNPAYASMVGWERNELLGRSSVDVGIATDLDRRKRTLEGILQQGKAREVEVELRRKDGSIILVRTNADTVMLGEQRFILSIIEDITERKRHEQELNELGERLSLALDSAELGTWNIDGRLDSMNVDERFKHIFGWKDETMNVAQAFSVLYPDDREPIRKAIEAATRPDNTQPYEVEYRVVHTDGSIHWVLAKGRSSFKPGSGGKQLVSFNGTVMDITARKLAEEAQRKLAAIVESSDDAILSRDLNGFITSWNKSAERIFGFTAEEVIGKITKQLYPADRRNEEEELLERVRNGERIEHFETVRIHKDGSRVDVALTLSPLKDHQGHIIGASKVMRDITAIKKAREAVRLSEERFHLLADNVAQLIWMADADGSNFWFNQRWTEFSGMTLEQLRVDTKSLHHPDHHERVNESLKAQAEKGLQWEEQFPLKSKEGVYHWFLAMAMPVKDAEGRVVRWFGTLTDITKERADRELIQESEERFRMLADHMSQMAYMADARGMITWVNRRWIDYTGLDVDQMNNGGWGRVVDPAHFNGMASSYSSVQAKGEPWEYVFRLRSTTGEYRWFLSRSVPIKNENGEVQRWFGTNTDITEQKLAEEALEESARHKDHFLATLAHELRNPLAPLKNGLQLMELSPDDPDTLETTRAMMVRQLDHMVRLVDDLMDLSRISSGKIELVVEQVELAPVVATALESCKPLIERREHDLSVHQEDAPLFVHGDKARLTQVVANLVNNAAKYTPPGGRITVAVEQQQGEVVVRVKDTGIGIEPNAMPRVFDMFAQISADHRSDTSGLGIGLNIVQRLVHMHKGRITGHSEGLGKGCEFTVHLPLVPVMTASTPEAAPLPKADTMATRRVLVVDDNQDAAISMSLILKKQGHVVETAHDGVEGVAKAELFRPHVIFMDIGMPRMNGYEACKTVRTKSWGRDIFIIALSGWGQAEDRTRSEEAGFDEHIVKPIERKTLIRLIQEAPVRLEQRNG